MKYFFVFFLSLAAIPGPSQEIRNFIAEYDGEKIILFYDLLYNNASEEFRVTLYNTFDNYLENLINVSGDIGDHVLPGRSKKITWYVKNELPANFNGNLRFKLEVQPMNLRTLVPKVISFLYPIEGSKLKRGNRINISWEGGDPNSNYRLDLYQNENKKQELTLSMNSGQFDWKIPKSLAKGHNYRLKLTKDNNDDEFIFSDVFLIRSKSPLVWIVSPVIIAGVATYLIIPEEKDLPAPIDPY